MDSKEILKFCLEKGLLLDNEVLNLFSEVSDIDSIKLIIEKIQSLTQQRIITKSTLDNKDQFNKVFLNLPEKNQKSLEKLKIKLGLSIEISKEIESNTISDSGKEQELDEKKNNEYLKEDVEVKILSEIPASTQKIEVKDFVRYFRNRFSMMRSILQEHPQLNNLVSINKISGNKQGISIIGIVSNKSVTKNKNIILELEDLTGKIKVLFNNNKKLYEAAGDIALDSVIGVNGSGNREILFANEVIFPEALLLERVKSPYEEYAVFIGDLHFGSKLFLEDNFLRFIDYLNGNLPNTPEVSKIKYLFIVGDLISGVGVYPDQEKDLKIIDLEEQFLGVARLLSKIRKDIKIIISSGNHYGVRLMEPQPIFDEKYAWPLFNMKNIVLTGNPCTLNIGARKNFSGFNILTYHGFSFPYYANNVSSLMLKKAMNTPEEIMKYLLKSRHLAPTHSSVQYFPFEDDYLMVNKIPDIFVAAHTHKSAVSYYNNILIISTSCWESMTPYQEKMGNEPDHCKVPLFNLKTRVVKILDFDE